jgi:hypothetical protein
MGVGKAFWSQERNLTTLLVILAGFHLLLPLAASMGAGALFSTVCLSLLAVSGVLTSFSVWYVRMGVRAAALISVLISWWELGRESVQLATAAAIADSALVFLLAAVVGAQVFNPGPTTSHRIRGAVAVYMLMGMLFGYIYQVFMFADPGAFRFPDGVDTANLEQLRGHATFFSFVTLTTVGYGDITPVAPFVRSLATIEAVTGQLYLAITIARLVSSHATTDDREPGHKDDAT